MSMNNDDCCRECQLVALYNVIGCKDKTCLCHQEAVKFSDLIDSYISV